ncbi:Ankyrin repeat domain-containing protein 54 [Camponotus floridanus]|uniref:Ankyrin repeat domain-containing protein 54 n=1 Tax=Camponotus floridanus TaxID=104421 RepID=E2AN12_CAMFO|nr:ankyrin repeat domain-containing protein 54 [Camponotus floridanus]XP_025264456.1 ankyrin repeat domain-containing protein 54 [Camponotus floridanus]EFN65170.1 Ankyrin repeat domain-containing protein 54 [Camponotus floridanus]
MTSVDSGVETGNDSNDSSGVQHENQQQHVQVTSSSIKPFNNEELRIQIDKPIPRLCLDSKGYSDLLRTNTNENSVLLQCIANCWRSDALTDFNQQRTRMLQDSARKSLISKMKSKQELITPRTFGPYGSKIVDYNSYCTKIKSRISRCRRSFNSLKDWQIYHIGLRMRLAATVNNTMLMSSLLQSGVSPNCSDSDGRTPLHHAACRGYTEMVQLLLENGADPNQRDCIGNTPLHLAAVTSKISVVTLLLTAGTNVLALDKYGYNPLQLAKAKLRMLYRNYKNNDMDKVKQEMHEIINMLLAYLLKQKNMQEQVETLSNFCSRLSLSNTSDQVQDDVKDLLANIDSLNITD